MGKTVTKTLYGSIMLVRSHCPICRRMAIVVDGSYLCCGMKVDSAEREATKRMVEGEARRYGLCETQKKEILTEQNRSCFYCGCDLDNTWYISTKMKNPRLVSIHFDHIIPWAYSRETIRYGMVASCNVCNALKGSRYFTSEEEAREYIRQRRELKGIIIL